MDDPLVRKMPQNGQCGNLPTKACSQSYIESGGQLFGFLVNLLDKTQHKHSKRNLLTTITNMKNQNINITHTYNFTIRMVFNLTYPDLDGRSKSSAQPVTIRAEAQCSDNIIVI